MVLKNQYKHFSLAMNFQYQKRGPPARAILAKDDPREKCVHIYPGGEWNNAYCKQERGYICSGPPPEKSNQDIRPNKIE